MGEKQNDSERLRLIGVFMTVPFVLGVPPVIGWAIGRWLDGHFGTIIFTYLFILFGIIAGIREFFRIVRKYGDRS